MLFFLIEVNFRKIASNGRTDLRKLENFVRSKYYPDKAERGDFRKSCTKFKIVNGHHREQKKGYI